VDRNPEQIHFVERNPHRPDGAFEDRRERDVEFHGLGSHEASGFAGFLASLDAQVDVGPAGEPVFPVPGALAVSK
jgi:hypothetical protein